MIGSILGGRYRILSLLGAGAMGEVYLAQHLNLGRKEAVKILKASLAEDPQFVARFRREARAINRVQHPNIVGVYDFGKLPDGRFFLAMEYADGKDLQAVQAEVGPFPLPRALSLLAQLSQAVGHAHRCGVVHRDLKPENLLVVQRRDQPELLKILDFGVAKIIAPDHVSSKLTAKGEIFGTVEYMAPEQLLGAPETDPRSDLYALGCIAFELVVGAPPFSGRPMEIASAHLSRTPERPSLRKPELPPQFDELVRRCLEKDPERRFATADEILEALKRIPGYQERKAPSGRRLGRPSPASSDFEPLETEDRSPPPPEARWEPQAPTHRITSDDVKLARQAAIREVAEALVDLGYSGYALLLGTTDIRQAEDELLRCDSEIAALASRLDELDRSAIERENSLRFAIGELGFALTQAQAEGLATDDLQAQVTELDARLAQIHDQTEERHGVLTDRAIEAAAARAVAVDKLDDLFARLEPIIDEEAPRYRAAHPTVEAAFARLESFRRMLTDPR